MLEKDDILVALWAPRHGVKETSSCIGGVELFEHVVAIGERPVHEQQRPVVEGPGRIVTRSANAYRRLSLSNGLSRERSLPSRAGLSCWSILPIAAVILFGASTGNVLVNTTGLSVDLRRAL